MYSPSVLKPSYAPVKKSKSSSSGKSSLFSLIVIPFIIVGCVVYYLRYRRRVSAMLPAQVQPAPQVKNSAGPGDQPNINYGPVVQPQPMVYGSNMQQPQPQQPYTHSQPGYIQMQPQQPQGYGHGQLHPEPQGYGYGQPHPQGNYGQLHPEPQGYGQGQPHPQGNYGQLHPEPQAYSYGNSVQPQHQSGHSPAQAQLLSSGDYAQRQPYNSAVVYPEGAAVPMYDDHGQEQTASMGTIQLMMTGRN
eukprot:gene32531-42142_t